METKKKSKTAKTTKTKLVKSKKPIPNKAPAPKDITKFCSWCRINGLSQRQIMRDTDISIGCIGAMWYKGTTTLANIRLISMVYKLDRQKLIKMVREFDNSNPIED
jgi:hypothetical protein